jgi:hypothetical protein
VGQEEEGVRGFRLGLEQAGFHGDARIAKLAGSALRLGIRIGHGEAHGGDAGLNQRQAARRSAAEVGAGLEGHIGMRAPGRWSRIGERGSFGMRPSGAVMPAFSYDPAVPHQDASDAGIGRRPAPSAQLNRPNHPGAALLHPPPFGCGVWRGP